MSEAQLPAANPTDLAASRADRTAINSAPSDERLLLLAQEADELPLISALTQSAVLRASGIAYDQRARRLVLLLNRYRWETNDQTRVQSALRFESVTAVQRRGWASLDVAGADATAAAAAVLELLAFTYVDGAITANFGGGAALRIAVECVDLVLEDISGPWRASREPQYD
jgi:hypothetical protein